MKSLLACRQWNIQPLVKKVMEGHSSLTLSACDVNLATLGGIHIISVSNETEIALLWMHSSI